MQAFILMSFVALLRGAGNAPQQAEASRRQYKYEKVTVQASIELGARVAAFMERIYGDEEANKMLTKIVQRSKNASKPSGSTPQGVNGSQPSAHGANGSQPRAQGADCAVISDESDDSGAQPRAVLPYGFWRRFIQEDMQTQYTSRTKQKMSRALQFWALRRHEGARSQTAMRGFRPRDSCRSDGGAHNSLKAVGLGFALLQYFVDYIQRLMCRADSIMLMTKAREMRRQLEDNGWPDASLPKLDGDAGRQWFKRWRATYGIVRKITGMKLKVQWTKVKRRIRVFLGNVFRLRAFWDICHPGTPMRFLSLDQKPSWFNNAGHTGTYAMKGGSQPSVRENFHQTRQRYSILTAVPSWGHTDPDLPPKIAILFKAKPGGTVVTRLRKDKRVKPWMKVQVQDHGSYKSVDVVEALDWMLPQAGDPKESIVVLLDWYSGHLTEEVAELVRRKGHVLVFHGGGCTPFTQVNDTHLHAMLALLLIQTENIWARDERQRLLDMGKNKTPKMTREEIISMVQTVWLSIDHAKIAEKGYEQTGPTMPLTGAVAPDDVYKDLLRVMEELDESSTPTEVGMTLRDEAVAFVRDGHLSGKWTTWSDAHKLIEEQDGRPDAEGLEAFGAEACEEDDEESESSDDDDEDDDKGGDEGGGDGGSSKGPSAKDPADRDPSDDDMHESSDRSDADGDGGLDGNGPGGGAADVDHIGDASTAGKEEKRSIEIAAARRLLYDEAVRNRDDKMVRSLRKDIRMETVTQKGKSTDVGLLLQKRMQEQRAEETKRRRGELEEERLAAKSLEESKQATAKLNQQAQDARLAALKQVILNRRDAEARRQADVLEKNYQMWLQTQYPATLARHAIDQYMKYDAVGKKYWGKVLENCLKDKVFERPLVIMHIWEVDKSLTLEWGHLQSTVDMRSHQVRCGLPFDEVTQLVHPKTHFSKDAVGTLLRLFQLIVPCADKVFKAGGPYALMRILYLNDHVMEKAFVYGMMCLSKWLGKERFPHGVYGKWPPEMPPKFVPKARRAIPIDLVIGPPPLPPPPGEDDVPPNAGGPSSSSKSISSTTI